MVPPQDDWLKQNFDGTFLMEKQMAGMGIIIRNTKGEMITFRSNIRETGTPLQTESEAALMEIRTANALGVKKIIIEGDSSVVIQTL